MPTDQPFSNRYGYSGAAKEIGIYENAPEAVRHAFLDIARELGRKYLEAFPMQRFGTGLLQNDYGNDSCDRIGLPCSMG